MAKNRSDQAYQFCRPDRDVPSWAGCLERFVGTQRAGNVPFLYSFIFQTLIGLIELKTSIEGDWDLLAFAPSGTNWSAWWGGQSRDLLWFPGLPYPHCHFQQAATSGGCLSTARDRLSSGLSPNCLLYISLQQGLDILTSPAVGLVARVYPSRNPGILSSSLVTSMQVLGALPGPLT